MMFGKTLMSVALAAGFAMALAMPVAQAQSAHSDGLLDVSPELRQSRIDTECGAIGNAHLRASCIDSLNIDEDRRSPGWRDGLTGGGTGMVNPMSPGPYSPNMPISDAGR